MAVNPNFVYDWAFEHFVPKVQEYINQGFRVLSLSQYGEGAGVRFAGVFDKRPGPPADSLFAYTVQDFIWATGEMAKQGYYPVHIAATGGGANTRVSAVFEQLPAAAATEVTLDLNPVAVEGTSDPNVKHFRDEVDRRAFDGWIPLTATIYDDVNHPSRIAVIWQRNHTHVAWNAFAGLSHDNFQTYFNQQWSVWGRLAYATGSARGWLLATYRDDQIGPIGRGFVARHGLSGPDFDKERAKWQAEGFHLVCLQGYGAGEGRRFTALFVNNEKPVARTLRRTGSQGVAAIDQAVIDLMKASNIRGAALAIVDGTRLVYARGYSWAEPDYPPVLPTTCFRLASVSKIVAALGIHQLVAEGLISLGSTLPTVLPLTNPDGSAPTNTAYLHGTVASILEYGGFFHRYEDKNVNVAQAFGTSLPVTHEMIARYMLTVGLRTQPNDKLDDFGYFLAGEIIKRARGKSTLMAALTDRLLKPLQITRVRTARSLVSAQPADEARYHPRDLGMTVSLMSPSRPIVPRGYGDEHFETRETSGGLSGAVVDVARLLAAMNAKPYTPLGRTAVESLIAHAAVPGRLGHGFDWLELFDPAQGRYRGPKGGLLQTSQSGTWFETDGLCTVVVWNGVHTGSNLTLDDGDGAGWYPRFDRVLNAAAGQSWPVTDLFPTYGMASLPTIQPDWRWCKKCQSLFFGGHQHGVCPAGGAHDPSASGGYTLVWESPYQEPQRDWRWCRKCEGLFHTGLGMGVCPAGGAHDMNASGHYSVA